MEEKVTLDRAIEIVDENVDPLPAESVEVLMACGRVLSERVNAWVDLPGANVSTLDGFAVRSADLAAVGPDSPVRLAIAGSSIFNNPYEDALPAMACVKVVTGALLTEDMDAVLSRESVLVEGDEVVISAPAGVGDGVRVRADEFRVGEAVAEPGAPITPGLVSLLIAAGWSEVKTARMPRARVLAVGDELKGPGQMIGPGQVYPSSAAMVMTWLRLIGVTDVRMTLVADDPLDILEALPEPHVADLVVTLGGTGDSDQDVVMEALDDREVEMLFRGVRAKPGHFSAFGMLEDMPVVCLPGGPGAAEMMFQFLVRRTAAALLGVEDPDLTVLNATMAGEASGRDDVERLVRVRLEREGGCMSAHPLFTHKVHQDIAEAHGVVRVPPGGNVGQGQEVEVILTKY